MPPTMAKGNSPGTPPSHPHSAQQRLARAHAVGLVLGPHAHTNRTRDTRVAEPRLPAPEDEQPEEGQRLTPDAPHNRGKVTPYSSLAARSPPQGTEAKGTVRAGPPHPHTRAHSKWVADPDGPPGERKDGGGGAPELRRPSQRWTATPPGDVLSSPPQRKMTARKGTRCGAGAGCPRPHQPHPGHTGRGTLPAHPPKNGQQGEGQRLTPDTPHSSGRQPPGTAPHHANGTRPPAEHARQVDSAGPPCPRTRAHSTPLADPGSPPEEGSWERESA